MKIYAHRGSSGENLEMTMSAYLAAIDDGADGFECDVRLTKDALIACIHDGNTRRISKSNLIVSKNTMQEIKKVAPIISLEELLSLAIASKKDLLIESKHPVVTSGKIERKVLELLALREAEISKAGIEVICMSFSWFAVERFRKRKKSCTVAQYFFQVLFARTENLALGISLIKRYPRMVRRLKKQGKRILVWTVNDVADMKLCRELGVDGLITNFPKRAVNE